MGPIAGTGLSKPAELRSVPGCIYSVRPMDKASLNPFFVASIRSQSSSAIPGVHVCERKLAGVICTDHLHFVAIPLNQTLVHCGRNTTIGVNPIPPKQHCVCTLTVDDQERGWDGLAANCQLHIEDTLCLRWLTIEIIEHHIGLDKISSGTTQPAQH